MRRPRIDRRDLGKAMVAIGVVGVVLSVVGTIVGYRLVAQVNDSVDRSLVLTRDGLTSVQSSIEVSRTLVDTAQVALTDVSETLGSVSQSLQDGVTALGTTQDFLSGSLPDSIDAVNAAMPTITEVAANVDGALRVLSAAPFGPDYEPDVPFDQAVDDLADALAPLPRDLRAVTDQFGAFETSTARVRSDIVTLQGTVDGLVTQLDEVDGLLDQYAATAAEAGSLADDSRSDLGDNARLAKVMVIVLGLVFGLGQIVPIWLGRVLMAPGPHVETIVLRSHEADAEAVPDDVT